MHDDFNSIKIGVMEEVKEVDVSQINSNRQVGFEWIEAWVKCWSLD